MDQIIRDMAAVILILGGVFVTYLELAEYKRCRQNYRWIFLVKALAGICVAILFTISLLRLFPGGSDIVTPTLGRPVFIILLLALALGAIHNRRITGGC